ncbi:MAG: arginine--tRNA ligase [Legionellaceae bacterium]|nr:arginine--tRNA ligase [Legionellaceae bacterium]
MKEVVLGLLQQAINSLQTSGEIAKDLSVDIKVDRTKDKSHGDFASNIALILAGKCGQPPRKIADLIVGALPDDDSLDKVAIAGPGFINFYMHATDKLSIVADILAAKEKFGCCNIGQGEKVLLEFVSANPTGPLHVGHGRGAAFGATLANLLKCAGFDVTSEYYVNDCGRQMNILAVSAWVRYLSLSLENVVFPANGYKGDYVTLMAETIFAEHGDTYVHPWEKITQDLPLDEPEGGDKEKYIDGLIASAKTLLTDDGFAFFHSFALTTVLDDIKKDLSEFGVNYDSWFSEKSLEEDGSIKKALDALSKSGYTYEKEGAIWFKSTEFGDEKDRVLVRANGQNTYFAPDVAYHWNKYDRGFDRVINIFGADHHGYVTRLKSAVKALGHDDNALNVILVQFANLYRNNERVQMSTRSGSFVSLRELREEVSNDAARFFYVMRKSEQHMDFDLELAKSQSSDNPVYYIQYGHARISSVLRQLEERSLNFDKQKGLDAMNLLTSEHEVDLMLLISRYPEVIAQAAKVCEPHQIAYYLRDLATGLHSYYNAVQLLCEDENLRSARLCLLDAIRQVIKNGLNLLGVSSPESM